MLGVATSKLKVKANVRDIVQRTGVEVEPDELVRNGVFVTDDSGMGTGRHLRWRWRGAGKEDESVRDWWGRERQGRGGCNGGDDISPESVTVTAEKAATYHNRVLLGAGVAGGYDGVAVKTHLARGLGVELLLAATSLLLRVRGDGQGLGEEPPTCQGLLCHDFRGAAGRARESSQHLRRPDASVPNRAAVPLSNPS